MQDINPIRRTVPVSESTEAEDVDMRTSVGVARDKEEADNVFLLREEQKSTHLNPKEEFAFSSLYSPTSRKNSIQKNGANPIKPPKIRARKNNNNVLTFFIGAVLFLCFVMYTFVYASVRVDITPLRTSIPVDQTIVVPSIDIQIGTDVIVITASSTDSVDVPRRGESKVETKASGVITIYNNNSSAPQKLITNTRFESKTGKIYRIAESVTVPGMTGNTPGSIDVTVFADSIGSEYNTSAAEFSIPGFKGTALANKFYAKTKSAISGGASGLQTTVADEDIEAAHNKILTELNKKIASEIESKKPSDEFIYLPDATSYTTTDNRKELITDSKAKYTETIVAKAIFIRKDYLAKRILENTSHTEEEKLRLESTEQLVFGVPAKDTKINEGDVVFTVTGAPSFISDLDETRIAARLVGVSKSEFAERMKEFSGIDKAEPHFNPLWVSRFPNDTKRIEIQILKN
ncbi:MAG: hypothetical protein RI996_90 [Candidatus Parcubacteria bacterium]|jgi:hypothetical protein